VKWALVPYDHADQNHHEMEAGMKEEGLLAVLRLL
jgi:hypothetical protein